MWSKIKLKLLEFVYLRKIKKDILDAYLSVVHAEYTAMKEGTIEKHFVPVALYLSPTQISMMKYQCKILHGNKDEDAVHKSISTLVDNATTASMRSLILNIKTFEIAEEVSGLFLKIFGERNDGGYTDFNKRGV